MSLQPVDIIILEKHIAIKWNDNTESFISNVVLRKHCPCANCSGESDIFGNIYRSENKISSKNDDKTIMVNSYRKVGHYAIRIMWRDGHSNGIYSYDLLKKLDDKE